jgi:GntR family transcriptional repressor for pyruvate dehydrogenase complex
MSESLRPVSRPRLYEQLVERLRAHIEEAELQPGDRLPAERDLAERLGVSRNSVKQATVVLEVQGIVEIRHGGGTYLRRRDFPAEPVAALLDRRQRLPDVLDAREAIETKMAELAADRRTEDDLVAMDAALDAMRHAIKAGDLGCEADRDFHTAVAAASHNPVLIEFYRQLAPQIAETRAESLRQPGRPPRSLAQHQRIADAIRAGNMRQAAAAARRHVRTVGDVRLLSWRPDDEAGLDGDRS